MKTLYFTITAIFFLMIGSVSHSYALNFDSVKKKYLPLVNVTDLHNFITNNSEFKKITHGYDYEFETALAHMTYLQNDSYTIGPVDIVYFLYESHSIVNKTLAVTVGPDNNLLGMKQYSPWDAPIWYPRPALSHIPIAQNRTEQKIDINNLVNIMPPDPLDQVKHGVSTNDVDCFHGIQNLYLVIKVEDGSPACVRQDTVTYLINRGWALSQTTNESISISAQKPAIYHNSNGTVTVTVPLDIKIDNMQKLSQPLSVVIRYTNGTIYQSQQISMNSIPANGSYKYDVTMTSNNPDDIFGHHSINVIHYGNVSQISVDVTK